MQWYLKVLKNYVGFTGRARRREYWMFTLVNIIITFLISIIEIGMETEIFSIIYGLAVFLPSLAVCFRRLHDTGRSAWWLLILLIPVIGWIILLVFYCEDGQSNNNKYGPNPKNAAA